MSLLTDSVNYDAAVYQLDTTDPVLGGPSGPANLAAQNLANRTAWLRARALASLRTEGITPVTGAYGITVADVGHILSVHNPAAASFSLPDMSTFPVGNPFTILVTDDGSSNNVSLTAFGTDTIEDWLSSGSGVGVYHLVPGTRLVLIYSGVSWVVAFKTVPAVAPPAVSGYLTGDVAFSWGPIAARAGFLLCNGAAISRATYAALFAVISTLYGIGDGATTFNVPDARDLFPRIHNGTGVYEAARIFGTTQMDDLKAHTHTVDDSPGLGQGASGPPDTVEQNIGTKNTGSTGGLETRPKNITMNAYIKY
jgi:microcystin-dependent protein